MEARVCSSRFFLLLLNLLVVVAGKTCTDVETSYTTITGGTRTHTHVLPTVTKYQYSSTVLQGTPYAGAHPTHFPITGPSSCAYETGSDIPPSSSVPAAAELQAAAATAGGRCTTTATTTTNVTVAYICTTTEIASPPPILIHKRGVLTTAVPSFCTQGPYISSGNSVNESVYPIQYPYFAQTKVECCIACLTQFAHNLVASGFIKSGLDCQCLVNTGAVYPGKSSLCPRGIDPYNFGAAKPHGNVFPGPCGS